MARERRDTAARQSDQREAATSTAAGAGASAPVPPLSSELADQHRQQLLALVRALARDAAREDHEHDIAGH